MPHNESSSLPSLLNLEALLCKPFETRRSSIHETMREKMEKFNVLPFSIGCVSHSSVATCENQNQPAKLQAESRTVPTNGERPSAMKMKNSVGFLPLPRPNISAGLQKIMKSIKNLSQFFILYEEDEEEEMEMEIGFPTDVQHVAHIGWEGFNNISSSMIMTSSSWDDNDHKNCRSKGTDMLSIPSLSMKQFELAMAAQASK